MNQQELSSSFRLLPQGRMHFLFFVAVSILVVSSIDAFSFQAPSSFSSSSLATAAAGSSSSSRCIDASESAQRDIYPFQQWLQQVGIQTIDGLSFSQTPSASNLDGQDACVIYTGQATIRPNAPIIQVPAGLTICSTKLKDELGGGLEATENALAQYSDATERLPLFRLMVKILIEVDNPYSTVQPWLNALPRRFHNGVAMTQACFDCLPPYAAYLTEEERSTYESFSNALRNGYLELSDSTMQDDALIQWAYNVALTRHKRVQSQNGQVEKKIAPMADMLNHGSFPNAEIKYDLMGNCQVLATQEIGPGQEICISYGDSSNPTPLFAKYGFLVEDSPTIFCKAIHLKEPMKALGYQYSDLLFDTSSGAVAPKVWDLFLYALLLSQPGAIENAQAFLTACLRKDDETKQAYHGHYFPYTLDSLKQFVAGMIQEIDYKTNQARSYDLQSHPRAPMIVAHNTLNKATFEKVLATVNQMG